MKPTRRRFIQDSSKAMMGMSAAAALGPLSRRVAASDKIVVGVIGCNGMGFADLRSLLKIDEVECGALCDVDENVLNERAAEVELITSASSSVKPKLYGDYRELLDNKDLDAVVIVKERLYLMAGIPAAAQFRMIAQASSISC